MQKNRAPFSYYTYLDKRLRRFRLWGRFWKKYNTLVVMIMTRDASIICTQGLWKFHFRYAIVWLLLNGSSPWMTKYLFHFVQRPALNATHSNDRKRDKGNNQIPIRRSDTHTHTHKWKDSILLSENQNRYSRILLHKSRRYSLFKRNLEVNKEIKSLKANLDCGLVCQLTNQKYPGQSTHQSLKKNALPHVKVP